MGVSVNGGIPIAGRFIIYYGKPYVSIWMIGGIPILDKWIDHDRAMPPVFVYHVEVLTCVDMFSRQCRNMLHPDHVRNASCSQTE